MLKLHKKILKPSAAVSLLVTAFLLQFSAGCVSIKTHAVSIEPSAHPVPETYSDYKKIEETELRDSSFTLFWFIPVTPEPDINQLIENRIISSGGDNIIEMKVWHERRIWILGTVNIIHVKGTIVRYND
ncbi:MAG: hypothetical protein JW864_18915 [Spirochaetes bacterium]|nr:hypothetical protein [Spirochaetota bacterium]